MSASFDPKFIKFSTASASSLLTGLISYWKLNETSGTLMDSVASNNSTSITGSPTYDASGKLGRCMTIAGAGYISMGTTTNLKPTTSFSVSIWFKTSSTAYQELISNIMWTSPSYKGWKIATEYSGTSWNLRGVINNNTNTGIVDSTTAINNGAWHLAVMTWNGSTLKLYKDGNQEGGDIPFTYTMLYNASSDFEIGSKDGGDGTFTGSVDEIGLWSKALTSGEITTLYNSGTGITHPF